MTPPMVPGTLRQSQGPQYNPKGMLRPQGPQHGPTGPQHGPMGSLHPNEVRMDPSTVPKVPYNPLHPSMAPRSPAHLPGTPTGALPPKTALRTPVRSQRSQYIPMDTLQIPGILCTPIQPPGTPIWSHGCPAPQNSPRNTLWIPPSPHCPIGSLQISYTTT